MAGPGGFSISPAQATRPEPVTLVMPASGYKALPYISDPCGHKVPHVWLTVHGLTATPHDLPHGTSYVGWIVSSTATPPAGGGRVSLVLASKQVIGHATTCHSGLSPYGSPHQHQTLHARPAAAVQAAPPAQSTALAMAAGIGGLVVIAAALVAGCWLWWARRHGRGAHR